MVVSKVTLVILTVWCFVNVRSTSLPLCKKPDVYSNKKHENRELRAKCPSTTACNLELVKYEIKKNPQSKEVEWIFDEQSTCYLCLPECCSNLPTLFGGFDNTICDEYLRNYGYNKGIENVWTRYDKEVLTYLVTKYQTENNFNVFLRLPSEYEICAYIINNHKYLEKRCRYIGFGNASGDECPQGESRSGGMCAKPAKIGG